MTAEELAHQVADRTDLLRAERETIRPDEFTDLLDHLTTATELVELYDDAHRLEMALRRLKDSIAIKAGDILDGDVLEWGDYIVSYRSERRRKLINRDAFVEWLGPEDFARVVSMPSSGGKVTTIRQLCAERGVDWEIVEDTFFDYERTAPKLTFTPKEIVNG